MSGQNGEKVIRIGKKGRRTFALGDDESSQIGQTFTVDVVHVYNQYLESTKAFENEEGKIPPEAIPQVNKMGFDLLAGMAGFKTPREAEDAGLTLAMSLEFFHLLEEEFVRLADFFAPKSKEESSSPAKSELIYET